MIAVLVFSRTKKCKTKREIIEKITHTEQENTLLQELLNINLCDKLTMCFRQGSVWGWKKLSELTML